MMPTGSTPPSVIRAATRLPTAIVVGEPIDVARIVTDWFGNSSACCTTTTAPLPFSRST